MEDIIKSAKNILKLANSPKVHNAFNNEVDRKTKEYQKVYGFEISDDPKHPTWNNEADAFKHTFGSAVMALKSNLNISEFIGNLHEWQFKNNPAGEENMDLWNNAVGREIAKEIRKQYNPIQVISLINNGQMNDIIAQNYYNKIKKTEPNQAPFF